MKREGGLVPRAQWRECSFATVMPIRSWIDTDIQTELNLDHFEMKKR